MDWIKTYEIILAKTERMKGAVIMRDSFQLNMHLTDMHDQILEMQEIDGEERRKKNVFRKRNVENI